VALAVTVLVTMLAALVLLPALLSLFGARLERAMRRRRERVVNRSRARPHDAGDGVAARGAVYAEGRWWRCWSDAVARRPWVAALVPLVALVAACVPVLDMRLGFADAGNDAGSKTSTRAYELLAAGFGPGVSGPLVVVVDGGGRPVDAAVQAVQGALGATAGVAGVVPPIPAGGDLAMVIAFPASAPQDEATERLVAHLRDDVLGPVARDNGVSVLVGGPTAAVIDVSAAIAGRLALFVAVVVGLSMLLLLVLFRSILIPLKAAVLNLLSVGAAIGVVTMVFQHGAFGVPAGPIEAYVPVMIFAIVFGLSMDYEVFLLARMHEEWARTRDAAGSVREGLATTGRVVTAAAAIMVVVFGAFVLSPDRMLQQFGLGLAVAVLIDAVIIRCLLLPAAMHLMGDRAWWLPEPLARRLPRLVLERR
jgi:RND superfamily putative drug exporter